MNRLVNRRIRLFLAALTLAFGGLLVRAGWLQGVRAESLSSVGRTQHREDVTIPAGRGTIYDRKGVELALGEQATTVYANPMQVTRPRATALAVKRTLGLDADRLLPEARRSLSRVRLHRAAGGSGPGSSAPAAEAPRARLLHGGAPQLSAAFRRRAGARLRRHRRRGPRRARAAVRRRARRPCPARRRSSRTRPAA